jgi:hypothetical protein
VSGDQDSKLAISSCIWKQPRRSATAALKRTPWMLSVNSAIVLYGYLQADKMAVGAAQKAVWMWAIPAAGAIVCLAWAALLTSNRKPREICRPCGTRGGPSRPAINARTRNLPPRPATIAFTDRAMDPRLFFLALCCDGCCSNRQGIKKIWEIIGCVPGLASINRCRIVNV